MGQARGGRQLPPRGWFLVSVQGCLQSPTDRASAVLLWLPYPVLDGPISHLPAFRVWGQMREGGPAAAAAAKNGVEAVSVYNMATSLLSPSPSLFSCSAILQPFKLLFLEQMSFLCLFNAAFLQQDWLSATVMLLLLLLYFGEEQSRLSLFMWRSDVI